MKPIFWMGTSRNDLSAFPPEPGVKEIRIRHSSAAFRVVYLATRSEAIYVLHCFQKKTRKTRRRDLELARRRFRAIREGWSER